MNSKYEESKLAAMQKKYGKPTLTGAISAWYCLKELVEYIKANDALLHPHNFQLERRDIVEYIYASHSVIKNIRDTDKRIFQKENKEDETI